MRSGPPDDAPVGRRAQYAELTRQAILDAARTLFVEQGYFATKVEEIARTAQVSPATVYAVGGGKNGLLRTLLEAGTRSERMSAVVDRLNTIPDPQELLTYLIHATRTVFEEWSPLMRQVVVAAGQEKTVRDSQAVAHRAMRSGLDLTARRLAGMAALREGLEVVRAADLLWLHLCNAAYFIRTDDLGWTLEESETWLQQTLPSALLKPELLKPELL